MLLRNQRSMNAVAEARKAAHAVNGNTRAAYQCYGDPDWRLRPHCENEANAASNLNADAKIKVPSAEALVLYLESIVVIAKFDQGMEESLRSTLKHLAESHADS